MFTIPNFGIRKSFIMTWSSRQDVESDRAWQTDLHIIRAVFWLVIRVGLWEQVLDNVRVRAKSKADHCFVRGKLRPKIRNTRIPIHVGFHHSGNEPGLQRMLDFAPGDNY